MYLLLAEYKCWKTGRWCADFEETFTKEKDAISTAQEYLKRTTPGRHQVSVCKVVSVTKLENKQIEG